MVNKRDRLDSEASLQALEILRAQVVAEQDTAAELRRQNDLAAKTLEELTRTRQGQQQRVKLAFETNEKVSGLLIALSRVFRDIREINRRLLEAERRAERTDDILLLLLTERSPQKIEAAREDLEAEIAEREKNRRKLIQRRVRNLNRLEEMAAGHGALTIPVELQNQIEAEREALDELRGKS